MDSLKLKGNSSPQSALSNNNIKPENMEDISNIQKRLIKGILNHRWRDECKSIMAEHPDFPMTVDLFHAAIIASAPWKFLVKNFYHLFNAREGKYQRTALHVAAICKQWWLVVKLLQNDACPYARCLLMNDPLYYCLLGRTEVPLDVITRLCLSMNNFRALFHQHWLYRAKSGELFDMINIPHEVQAAFVKLAELNDKLYDLKSEHPYIEINDQGKVNINENIHEQCKKDIFDAQKNVYEAMSGVQEALEIYVNSINCPCSTSGTGGIKEEILNTNDSTNKRKTYYMILPIENSHCSICDRCLTKNHVKNIKSEIINEEYTNFNYETNMCTSSAFKYVQNCLHIKQEPVDEDAECIDTNGNVLKKTPHNFCYTKVPQTMIREYDLPRKQFKALVKKRVEEVFFN